MNVKALLKKESAIFAGCALFGLIVLPGTFVVVVGFLLEKKVITGVEVFPSNSDIPDFYKAMFVEPFQSGLLIFALFPYVITQGIRLVRWGSRRILVRFYPPRNLKP
jgi:hypothetical protein